MTEHERYVYNIKAEIIRKGLTNKEIAKIIGVPVRSYTARLRNFSKGGTVTFDLFESTAKALEVPVAVFFKT